MLADKDSSASENQQYLKHKRLDDLVQYRGHPAKPLERWQTEVNKPIAKIRYRVEQCFGTLTRRLRLDRARYFGLLRTEAQIRWAAIVYNLLKAHRKLERLKAVAA